MITFWKKLVLKIVPPIIVAEFFINDLLEGLRDNFLKSLLECYVAQ
jgi:hypothetical protein